MKLVETSRNIFIILQRIILLTWITVKKKFLGCLRTRRWKIRLRYAKKKNKYQNFVIKKILSNSKFSYLSINDDRIFVVMYDGWASPSLNTFSNTEISVDVVSIPQNAHQSLTTIPDPTWSEPRLIVPAWTEIQHLILHPAKSSYLEKISHHQGNL